MQSFTCLNKSRCTWQLSIWYAKCQLVRKAVAYKIKWPNLKTDSAESTKKNWRWSPPGALNWWRRTAMCVVARILISLQASTNWQNRRWGQSKKACNWSDGRDWLWPLLSTGDSQIGWPAIGALTFTCERRSNCNYQCQFSVRANGFLITLPGVQLFQSTSNEKICRPKTNWLWNKFKTPIYRIDVPHGCLLSVQCQKVSAGKCN